MALHIYRYVMSSVDIDKISREVSPLTPPTLINSSPAVVVDIQIDDSSLADLDEVMAHRGFSRIGMDPTDNPEDYFTDNYVGNVQTQNLLDNTTYNFVVGDITQDQAVIIDYMYHLPVGNKTQVGRVVLHHNGGSAEIEHAYGHMGVEISGFTLGASISGNNLRLDVTLAAIGEQPTTLVYKTQRL